MLLLKKKNNYITVGGRWDDNVCACMYTHTQVHYLLYSRAHMKGLRVTICLEREA